MNTVPFADMADDLTFSDETPARPLEEIARQRFVTAPAAIVHTELCKKCNGSGRFTSFYGRSLGECFACNGKGKMEFKTSSDQRAKAREQRQQAQERAKQANVEAFAAENPEAYAWIVAQAPRFDFASSMLEALQKWGALTGGQLAAVTRCMERDQAKRAERAAAKAEAVKAGPTMLQALHTVMQKHAKFYAGDLTLSRRREDQLVWIKHANAEKVIGKIDGGALSLWTRPGVDMQQVKDMLVEFEGAPLQAAMKYGKLSGRCCSCGRELTNDGSIEAGIGPICAEKFA